MSNVDRTKLNALVSNLDAGKFADPELLQVVIEEVYNNLDIRPDNTETLTKTNTTAYTPSSDYHPSTKRYVDQTVAGIVLGDVPDGSITKAKLSNEVSSQLSDHNFSVTATDASGKPTQTQYKRQNTTLYLQVDASNPDAKGNYQTITEKHYDADGTTLLKTVTWTVAYNANGLITSRTWAVT